MLGWAGLLIGLPIALVGALAPLNEYEATLGINAIDCDGPFGVYLFALPALATFGVGLIINGIRWRRRLNLVVALVCSLICAALLLNITRAVAEEREQADACLSR